MLRVPQIHQYQGVLQVWLTCIVSMLVLAACAQPATKPAFNDPAANQPAALQGQASQLTTQAAFNDPVPTQPPAVHSQASEPPTAATFNDPAPTPPLAEHSQVPQPKAVGLAADDAGIKDAVQGLEGNVPGTKRLAFLIGASEYSAIPNANLPACEHDVDDLKALLENADAGFKFDHVEALKGPQVTRPNIFRGLSYLRSNARKDDLVLIYFSGHGWVDKKGLGYWVTYETELDNVEGTAMAQSDINGIIGDIGSSRLVLLVDSCHAEATAKEEGSKGLDTLVSPEPAGEGRIFITSCKAGELSLIGDNDRLKECRDRSIFTHYVIEGLMGAADTNLDGRVTISELYDYVSEKTQEAAKLLGGKQEPVYAGKRVGDFMLAVNPSVIVKRAQETKFAEKARDMVNPFAADPREPNPATWVHDNIGTDEKQLDDIGKQYRELVIAFVAGPANSQTPTLTPDDFLKRWYGVQRPEDIARRKNISLRLASGKTNLDRDALDAADKDLDALFELDPSNSVGNGLRQEIAKSRDFKQQIDNADARRAAHDLDGERDALERALASRPNDQALVRRLNDVSDEVLLRSADKDFNDSRLEAALKTFEEVAKRPVEAGAPISLNRKRAEDGVQKVNGAIKARDLTSTARIAWANPREDAKAKVIGLLNDALNADPGNAEARNLRDLVQGWVPYTPVPPENSSEIQEAVTQAEVKEKQDDVVGALQSVEKVLSHDPKNASAISLKDVLTKQRREFTHAASGIQFCWIEPGAFEMGSAIPLTKAWARREQPQHEVTFTHGFYMGVYKVTRKQFKAYIEARANDGTDGKTFAERYYCFEQKAGETSPDRMHAPPGRSWKTPGFAQQDNHPVVCLTYYEAAGFCKWLKESDPNHKTYRLPTDAEWEYCARAGTATEYWWGDEWWGENKVNPQPRCNGFDLTAQASKVLSAELMKERSLPALAFRWRDNFPNTSPVTAFHPNPWGLYDMGGNVWDRTSTVYKDYTPAPVQDPLPDGLLFGQKRVLRGGAWDSGKDDVRCAYRNFVEDKWCDNTIGFRVVREP